LKNTTGKYKFIGFLCLLLIGVNNPAIPRKAALPEGVVNEDNFYYASPTGSQDG